MGKIARDITFVVTLLAAPATAAFAGQKPATPRTGEEVIVTQSGSGEELRGRLVELSPTSMSMLVNGERVDVPIENVLRIDARNDSLKNGTIIGAAIMGGLSALACAEISNAGGCAMVLATNTGIGALAGAGVDALHKGRTPIYIKAGKSEAGLQVRLRF
jgi:hypothetical protein